MTAKEFRRMLAAFDLEIAAERALDAADALRRARKNPTERRRAARLLASARKLSSKAFRTLRETKS